MIKVKLEIILKDNWDGYIDPDVSEDSLLEDILTTISDQSNLSEDVISVTIKSKQLIK